MTTATEITTVLQDIVSTVDQAKNLIDDLVDDNEERKEEERRGQMALEVLETVWRLHDSQVTDDGRLVCPTCQVRTLHVPRTVAAAGSFRRPPSTRSSAG